MSRNHSKTFATACKLVDEAIEAEIVAGGSAVPAIDRNKRVLAVMHQLREGQRPNPAARMTTFRIGPPKDADKGKER